MGEKRDLHGFDEYWDNGKANERENIVYHAFRSTERYEFDFGICSSRHGWTQYDTNQDAWYFGVWVHPEKRLIFSYTEGDLYLDECPTKESFQAELARVAEFYGDPPPAFTVIDPEKNTVTYIYDKRPE